MINIFPPIVKEFLSALTKAYTYNIRRNHYAIFGILWGIPVPVVSIGIGLYFSGLTPSIKNIILHVTNYPMHLFFLVHPMLFGIVFGAMGTVRDLKESQRREFEDNLRLMNEELKKANKKLQELDELKDSFLSIVTHELLTPLTTVQGYITFLKEQKTQGLTEEQIEMFQVIEEEADHLRRLIEELMDISKIQADKFVVQLAPTDITEVLNKVKATFEPLIQANQITLEDKTPNQLPLVLADPHRMTQVFSNLLNNAVKFTPPGGRISVYVQITAEKIVFCIEDTGIGIPKEEMPKIFDKFYQIDSTTRRKYSGCGLGLTITKSIIELHKGRMWVESEEGRGTKFFFEIKRCDNKTYNEKYDKSPRGARDNS